MVFAISADLKSLQGQLRTMEGQFQSSFGKIEGVISKANSVLGLFGVGLSAGALIGFGKTIIDIADNVSDLADQTGLSINLLGGLQSAAKQNGITINEMAENVLRAQKNLGQMNDEGKGTAATLNKLGLNIETMRNAKPDEFFETVAQKLAQIENRNDRAAVAVELFGRSGARANAAILQWVDEGMTKLDESTAQAYKRLGELKDQLAVVTVSAADFAIHGLSKILEKLGVINPSIEQLNRNLEHTKKFAPGDIGTIQRLEKQIAEAKTREEADAAKKAAAAAAQFKGLAVKTETPKGTSPAEKAQQQTSTFLEGLERQLSDIQVRSTELQFGPEAGLTAKLEAQFEEFKRKLAADKLPIPKGLEESFAAARDKIVAAEEAARKLKQQIDDIIAVGKMLNQDSAEWLNFKADLAALTKAQEKLEVLRDEFNKFKTGLEIEAIDTSTPQGKQEQRRRRIEAEALETTKKIEEMGKAAGMSQEEIAEAVNLAWSNAFKEINSNVEETTTFQQRAFERMHDAIGDITQDLIRGNIDSWEEFGTRVLDVIASITAEFVALQAKIALFGKDFGGQTGGVGNLGGLLGNVWGMFGGAGSTAAFDLSTAAFSEVGADIFASFPMPLFHRGGRVGDMAMPTRRLPAAIFHDAPRYHGGGWAGLKPDEMPIIAQKGERILPRWESAQSPSFAMMNGNERNGSESNRVAVDVNINGDIIPKAPWITKDEAVTIGIRQLDNRGDWMQLIEKRTSIKGS